MTPQEKAKELFDKYAYFVRMYNDDTPRIDMQKQCALIAVDEIIQQLNTIDFDKQSEDYDFLIDWWNQVKIEIDNTKQ